jgi:RNA polymerase sigma-70 factor (ECF subfamily)
MKVSQRLAHDPKVATRVLGAASPSMADADATRAPLEFAAVYRTWFHEVSRWARALGGLEADLDDLAQEVFLVVRRKLAGFDGANLPGWLYAITARTVSDYRRRAWFRNLFRRGAARLETIPSAAAGPAELLEEREARRALDRLLSGLSLKLRSTFLLFEIEGYSGEEIARLQGIPVATVWTRLYNARREVVALVRNHVRKEAK